MSITGNKQKQSSDHNNYLLSIPSVISFTLSLVLSLSFQQWLPSGLDMDCATTIWFYNASLSSGDGIVLFEAFV